MTNWSMFSLRCLLFCFFGGVGCLFPFLPLHMKAIGLLVSEAHIILIVAPLVAALGPLLVCPLADRLGGSGGRPMRVLLAVTVLLAALSYALLMCVPPVQRLEARQPAVNFSCEPHGAAVLQERCMEPACYEWPEKNIGPLMLNSCHYECQTEPQQSPLDKTTVRNDDMDSASIPATTEVVTEYDSYSGYGPVEVDLGATLFPDQQTGSDDSSERRKRHIIPLTDDTPPHLCSTDETEKKTCYVYTSASGSIAINASLLQATNTDGNSEEWCKYPLAGNFACRIPSKLLGPSGHSSCRVVCSLPEPYSSSDSVLAQSQCRRMIGDATVTFWSYLVVRSFADMFTTTAVGLLDAAVVIATRETNIGQGDVGDELIWGTLGFGTFAPIIGFLHVAVRVADTPFYWISFTAFVLLMAVSALILLLPHSMPLSRPEWWSRHARLMPLGGLKRHLSELIALSFILILLGGFWGALDTYLPSSPSNSNPDTSFVSDLSVYVPWHHVEMGNSEFLIGLAITVGAWPALALLWNAEKLVHYCGHSNLLISAFTFYIIRYIVKCVENVWLSLACEALQVFTLSLMWVTAILYMRQLVPRHLTVTGQGMAVLFHFCLGRCLGAVYVALISAYASTDTAHLIRVYQAGAIAAAIIATIYFIVYHCCLKPCCQVSTGNNPRNQAGVTQGPTTNGTYTPLRVYHNGSGHKGQFRY